MDYEAEMGLWYISKEMVSITVPFDFYLGNKKWPLLEELFSVNLSILFFSVSMPMLICFSLFSMPLSFDR